MDAPTTSRQPLPTALAHMIMVACTKLTAKWSLERDWRFVRFRHAHETAGMQARINHSSFFVGTDTQ